MFARGGLQSLIAITMISSAICASGQTKPQVTVDGAYFEAFGHYNRAMDSVTNSSVLFECRKTSMECIEVMTFPTSGNKERPSIQIHHYEVTSWNKHELIAELEGECVLQIAVSEAPVLGQKKTPSLRRRFRYRP